MFILSVKKINGFSNMIMIRLKENYSPLIRPLNTCTVGWDVEIIFLNTYTVGWDVVIISLNSYTHSRVFGRFNTYEHRIPR